jgi:hypothetical protein
MLRIPKGSPSRIRMDRLAEYMKEFAHLLGLENSPVFVGVKNASIGLMTKVSADCTLEAWKSVQTAKTFPESKPGRHLDRIENMLGEDSFGSAELRDASEKVIYLFNARPQDDVKNITVRQQGEVDGVVTGLVGADDTMHLHLRDSLSRDLKLIVRDEGLARGLLQQFRGQHVRLRVHGTWVRTDDGWIPESNRCTVDGFEVLDSTPVAEIFTQLAAIPGNGWTELSNATASWLELRGVS